MIENIKAIPVRPQSSSSVKDILLYAGSSYLKLNSNYSIITQSKTVNGKQFHLLEVHNQEPQSYIITALKIVSYCTVILPALAALFVYFFKKFDIY